MIESLTCACWQRYVDTYKRTSLSDNFVHCVYGCVRQLAREHLRSFKNMSMGKGYYEVSPVYFLLPPLRVLPPTSCVLDHEV